MKVSLIIAAGFFFLAHQANATTVQPTENSFFHSDMKTCYGKLNALKKFNPAEFRVMNQKLMTVVQARASLNAGEQYASPETMTYIQSMQTQSIQNMCAQINQKLDVEMIKKTMNSLRY